MMVKPTTAELIEKTGDKKEAPRGCLHIKTMERTPFDNRCYPFLLWIISLFIYIILKNYKNSNIYIELFKTL